MGFFIGLDLGQAADYSALAVLERIIPQAPEPVSYRTHELWQQGQPITPPRKPLPPVYHGRHLERFPLGTPYPKIVVAVQERLAPLRAMRAETALVVDKTGVGAPVVDLFTEAGLEPIPITITAGTEPTPDGYGWHVPKRDLV